jgi:CheY-like chemotaxis protein
MKVSAHPPRPRSRRVLICDNSERERTALRRVLKGERYLVEEAADGRSALAAVARARPDLILLELRLPDIDGSEVLDALRAEHDERALPIIVLSAERDGEVAAGCLALGANAYLTRPIRPGALLASAATQLEMHFIGALTIRGAPSRPDHSPLG